MAELKITCKYCGKEILPSYQELELKVVNCECYKMEEYKRMFKLFKELNYEGSRIRRTKQGYRRS